MRSKVQLYLRPVVMACYFVVLLIAVPLSIVYLVEKHSEPHVIAWFVAGIFVLATIPMSLWDISMHLSNYTQPDLQRYYVRIIWMVPIYSLDSWLALRFATEGNAGVFLDTARECYEAYVIYNFMMLLLTYLRKHTTTADGGELDDVYHGHMFPFKYWPFKLCFKPWEPGKQFIHRCTVGTLQYTLIRVTTTTVGMVCALAGYQHRQEIFNNVTNRTEVVFPLNKYYSDGEISEKNAYIYLAFINNVSQVWAMYCLVLFYYATRERLKSVKPFGKFMCVKLVVFFSFWQSVVIAILGVAGAIPSSAYWTNYTQDTVKSSIQDFLICIEMFFAAIAHHYAFSASQFVDYAADTPSCLDGIKSMWDVSDVRDDIVEKTRTVIPQRRGHSSSGAAGGDERTQLLPVASADASPVSGEHGAVNRTPAAGTASTQAGQGVHV
ncbi:transmembrane protein 184C-like [Sycon ciliatum]|uniref:transmembrane protein 184C-like n=1 Tax=Sycon ciliatum TaxID=27933 RepID=UPI0031F7089D